jgi:hypothetical protein
MVGVSRWLYLIATRRADNLRAWVAAAGFALLAFQINHGVEPANNFMLATVIGLHAASRAFGHVAFDLVSRLIAVTPGKRIMRAICF